MALNNSSAYSKSYLSDQDIAFAVMYSFIVVIGVPANCITTTIVRKTLSMHTTTNYLLMNLAVGDLTSLLFCPGAYDLSLTKVRLHKNLGNFICKFFVGNAVLPITLRAATLTVSTTAAERYLALVRLFQTGVRLTNKRGSYVIVFLWVFAALSCIPDFMANTIDTNPLSTYPCTRPWGLDEHFDHKGYIIFSGVFFGIFPCVVVYICYFKILRGIFITNTIFATTGGSKRQTLEDQRSKKQLLKLLVCLTVLFSVCSLPFTLFFIYLTAVDKTTVANNSERFSWFIELLEFLSSLIHSLIHFYMPSKVLIIVKVLKESFFCKSLSESNE